MPISFSIEASTSTVHTTVTGPILDADPVRYLSEVLEHPAYRPGISALVVCSDVDLKSFSGGAVRRLAEFTRRAEHAFSGSRVAVVADQPAVYGFLRMYQLLRDPPYPLELFRRLPEAEAWLAAGAPQAGGR